METIKEKMRVAECITAKLCRKNYFPLNDDTLSCGYLGLAEVLNAPDTRYDLRLKLYFAIRRVLFDYCRKESNYSYKTKRQITFLPYDEFSNDLRFSCNGTEKKILVKQVLERLSPMRRDIIIKRFWYGMSCLEIGKEIGKSRNFVEYEIMKVACLFNRRMRVIK